MQAQMIKTAEGQAVITSVQSLAAIRALIQTSFGCIAYLRELLPDDNFGLSYLKSSADSESTSLVSTDSPSGLGRQGSSGPKIKTVKRGFSTEADQLLDYLEEGVFHALEKNYLRSFVFSIYLDKEDPTNIIEAYTFNFTYYKVPGTNTMVPVISLNETMNKMSLNDRRGDGVTNAVMEGRAPTLGEIKQSVRKLLMRLLSIIQPMESLPARKYASFKIYYTDDTPDDYEPPYFVAGDAEKTKLFFSTHNLKEKPEIVRVGSVRTPYHSVGLSVSSIASFLPSMDNNSSVFGGLSTTTNSAPLSDSERKKQIEDQQEDTLRRKVLWSADEIANKQEDLVDAQGEIDPDFSGEVEDMEQGPPIGIRAPNGEIINLSQAEVDESMHVDVPANTKAVNVDPEHDLEPTQLIHTQTLDETPKKDHQRADSTFSNGIDTQILQRHAMELLHDDDEESESQRQILDLDTQPVNGPTYCHPAQQQASRQSESELSDEDAEMRSPAPERSKTRNGSGKEPPQDITNHGIAARTRRAKGKGEATVCDCGDPVDDFGMCFCEEGCQKWFHVWCMGFVFRDFLFGLVDLKDRPLIISRYHSADDERFPEIFQCFLCRLRNDPNSGLLNQQQWHEKVVKFKELALFRRALKVVTEEEFPENITQFKKRLGCEVPVAVQIWKRLENEGFIAPEEVPTEIDIFETQGGLEPKKRRPGRPRAAKKGKMAVVRSEASRRAFDKYFQPGGEVESELMGLKSLGRTRTSKHADKASKTSPVNPVAPPQALAQEPPADLLSKSTARPFKALVPRHQPQDERESANQPLGPVGLRPVESQTQLEATLAIQKGKRKSDQELPRGPKRVKISIGENGGVDLEDWQ